MHLAKIAYVPKMPPVQTVYALLIVRAWIVCAQLIHQDLIVSALSTQIVKTVFALKILKVQNACVQSITKALNVFVQLTNIAKIVCVQLIQKVQNACARWTQRVPIAYAL